MDEQAAKLVEAVRPLSVPLAGNDRVLATTCPETQTGEDNERVTAVPGPGVPNALWVYLNLPDSTAQTWLLHTARRALDCAVGIVLGSVATQARNR